MSKPVKMTRHCIVIGCANKSNAHSYYNLPKVVRHQGSQTEKLSQQRRDEWTSALRRQNWTPTPHSKVCSDHFITGKPASLYDVTNPDWIPTQKMGYKTGKRAPKDNERYLRAKRRQQVKNVPTGDNKRAKIAAEDPRENDSPEDGGKASPTAAPPGDNPDNLIAIKEEIMDHLFYVVSGEQQLSSDMPEDAGNSCEPTEYLEDSPVQIKEEPGTGDQAYVQLSYVQNLEVQITALVQDNTRLRHELEDKSSKLAGLDGTVAALSQDNARLLIELEDKSERLAIIEEKVKASTQDNAILQAELARKSHSLSTMLSLDCQVKALTLDNVNLRKELQEEKKNSQLAFQKEDDFKSNENKLKFYTGIPTWPTFVGMYEALVADLQETPKLTKFQRLVMFFLKLRLNLCDCDIAYRFNIHQSTVSRNFHAVLEVMAIKMACFVQWPSEDTLALKMPASFKAFFKEGAAGVRTAAPSDLLTKAHVWSNYARGSAVKLLIGLAPQETVCFVAGCWVGRLSDKPLAEERNSLEVVLPGDVIRTNRGFTVDQRIHMVMAEVRVPTFKKGKKQLDRIEIDCTRELPALRSQVERVIGLIQLKFKMLQSVLPVTLIGNQNQEEVISKIVAVCCAIVNLCPPAAGTVPND